MQGPWLGFAAETGVHATRIAGSSAIFLLFASLLSVSISFLPFSPSLFGSLSLRFLSSSCRFVRAAVLRSSSARAVFSSCSLPFFLLVACRLYFVSFRDLFSLPFVFFLGCYVVSVGLFIMVSYRVLLRSILRTLLRLRQVVGFLLCDRILWPQKLYTSRMSQDRHWVY